MGGYKSSSARSTPKERASRNTSKRREAGISPRCGQFDTVDSDTPKPEARISDPRWPGSAPSKRSITSRGVSMSDVLSRTEMKCNLKMRCFDNPPKSMLRMRDRARRHKMDSMGKKGSGEQFGGRLRLAREALGHSSAAAFAKNLDWNAQTYRQYERGERFPGFSELHQLAQAGVSFNWLFLAIPPAVTTVHPLHPCKPAQTA